MRLRLVLNRVGKILILLAIIMVVPLGVAPFLPREPISWLSRIV